MTENIINLLSTLKSTPWLQQIAAIVTIVGIPYAIFKLTVFKAKHKILFLPKETYHEAMLTDRPDTPQSLWLQLMVKNKGFEISRNAEAHLVEIWTRSPKKSFQKLSEFRAPVQLKWSHEGRISPIDILPRESRRLDVCFICQGEKILNLMAEGFPSGTIKNKIPPGNYIFIIKVISKNKPAPTDFLFEVYWDGKWKTLKGKKYVRGFKMFKKPVKSFSRY